MDQFSLNAAFGNLSTPLVADACLRLKIPFRCAPSGVRPVVSTCRVAGRALPARHFGSVDVFLEAFCEAAAGDVLCVDNSGRKDEACIGDLIALEARASGLAGIIVWGLHRDTTELEQIDFPVFTYGACPNGPFRVDVQEPGALKAARFGDVLVTKTDGVFADDNGVIFAPLSESKTIIETARAIKETERIQAEAIVEGTLLRDQLHFAEYIERRASSKSYSFRRHLRRINGAIEE